jgi:CheY-like chemotaxis protein
MDRLVKQEPEGTVFVSARRGFAMRILVVEDERVAADVLAKGLREHAYAVDVASDGAAALEQAGANDYDLILLDILLPRMNGVEVCRRLREDGQSVPILMLTARGWAGPARRRARRRCRRLPGQAVPFSRAARANTRVAASWACTRVGGERARAC